MNSVYVVLMSALRYYIREVISEVTRKSATRKLRVFDFDDTLVKSHSRVLVTTAAGKSFYLTAGEYAVYEPQSGDKFDYSEFSKVIDPEEIVWTGKILRNVTASGSEAVILTARAEAQPISEFLSDAGIPPIEVIALASSDPQKKADYIASRIENDGIDYVEFFDDSHKNIDAVKSLRMRYPDVKVVVRHVVEAV